MLRPDPSVPKLNCCDHCGSPFRGWSVIAGGADDRKQFCAMACYDAWQADVADRTSERNTKL
jgi:hypothetical protein